MALIYFASEHVGNLDDRAITSVVRPSFHVPKGSSLRPTHGSSNSGAVMLDDLPFVAWEIEVQDLVSRELDRATHQERDDPIADTIYAARSSTTVLTAPRRLVKHVNMSLHRDVLESGVESTVDINSSLDVFERVVTGTSKEGTSGREFFVKGRKIRLIEMNDNQDQPRAVSCAWRARPIKP